MNKFVYLFLLFLLGVCNNIGYVLVWVSSPKLSEALNQPNLVSLYMLIMFIIALTGRFLTMKFLLRVKYYYKVILVTVTFIFGYFSFFIILFTIDSTNVIEQQKGFYLSLIPTSLLGIATSVGELNLVGYFKKFPSEWLSGFYSGTGVAGIAGAVVTIIFSSVKINQAYMWLVTCSFAFIYFISFVLIEYFWTNDHTTHKDKELSLINIKEVIGQEEDSETNSGNERDIDNSKNQTLNLETLGLVYKLASHYIFHIGMTYFLGYLCVHMMERYQHFKYLNIDNQYMYYNLSYQCGVFISRSSIKIIKHIKKQLYLTIIQTLNTGFWLLLAYFGFIQNFIAMIILCVTVGLICGSSYVFGYYLIYEDKEINNDLRELTLNVAFNCSECFLIANSLLCLGLDNSIYS